MNRAALTTPTSLLTVLLVFTVWNSCAISRLRDKVDVIEERADSIQVTTNTTSGELESLKSEIDDVKTLVEEIE